MWRGRAAGATCGPHAALSSSPITLLPTRARALCSLCSQVLIVEDGTIKTFAGDFEDCRNMLTKEIMDELGDE